MRIATMSAQYSILSKNEALDDVLGTVPTIFQIECINREEHDKVNEMIKKLL